MVDSKRYAEWLTKSKIDLDAAILLRDHGHDLSLVAFHSQQCAEKALKAFALAKIGCLVAGHSLLILIKQACQIDSDFEEQKKNCAFLNQYYIETRYPADVPFAVSLAEANECIQIAENILKLVKRKL